MSTKVAGEKTVYFVRHGQSVGNVSPTFQGTESPLNETGVRQAEQIADRLTRVAFDALISSPLPRTKDTAEAIARATHMTIEYSSLFVERVKPSHIVDRPHTDPEAQKLGREWEMSLATSGMRVEDGENYDDLVARADAALAYLTQRPEHDLVVVTHGFFLRAMMARVLLGNTLTDKAFMIIKQRVLCENTGLTVFKYENTWEGISTWKLWIYNDHAHLG